MMAQKMSSSMIWSDDFCRTINTHVTGVAKNVSAACSDRLLEALVHTAR